MNSNEELLRAWLAAGDRGDVDAFDRYLHPEVVVHALPSRVASGRSLLEMGFAAFRGADEVEAAAAGPGRRVVGAANRD